MRKVRPKKTFFSGRIEKRFGQVTKYAISFRNRKPKFISLIELAL